MTSATATPGPTGFGLGWIFHHSRTEKDVAARPSDALVVFSVMWGMAMMFSAASQMSILTGGAGPWRQAATWSSLISAGLLVMNPRKTWLLLLTALLMMFQYSLRMPVSSNNQTIALYMNAAVVIAIASQLAANRGAPIDRDLPYEQMRVVARALLAVMYFYGIFHKINTGFLEPETSCATALYQPLARPFGLEDNLVGIYGAIAATFVIETVAIVCLYWRRFFWVGLLVSLPFHYVIPISGFSWYMDFSSLVFALYMLSVPREVAAGLYSTGVALVRPSPRLRAGASGMIALAMAWAGAAVIVLIIAWSYSGRSQSLMWHSAWLLVWTVFGGLAMLLIIRAALLETPYRSPVGGPRQRWWVYAVPAVLFVTCTSPYIGLKTESSIAMFSNLHTEGGVSNHLLFPKPPYLFDYQSKVARVIDASDPLLKERAARPGFALIEHDIAIRLMHDPKAWITYELDGQRFEKVTQATFPGHRPNWFERKLLDFKPVDWTRPKVCTH